jgi:cobalamin biosynthesis Mg chelatase CobN
LHRKTRKESVGVPYLKIMAVIIVLILLGLIWLVLSGYSA